MRVLVVGAGIAGLTAARTLADHGHTVQVVEKARAPGGRVATRRVLNGDADRPEHASLSFDHGAQYVTARDPRFAAEVEAWHAARLVLPWQGQLAAFDSEGREAVEDEVTRWVGVPGMSVLGRYLARDLDLACGVTVDGITRDADGPWRASSSISGPIGGFDTVILAVPAPQAVPLLHASPALAGTVSAVRVHACWAALVAFDERVKAPFDGAFVSSSPLGWIARDRSKPRRGFAETWVLHASADWSDAHVGDGADAAAAFLLNAFADLVRAPLPLPVHLSAHRWRYACADPPLAVGALSDGNGLIVCGDWCHGNRVEGAYLSGLAAAARALGSGL